MEHCFFTDLENIIRENMDKRGIQYISLSGELKNSTNELLKSECVLIVTGFVIKAAGVGENDGPPGAAALAWALEQLEKKVVLITDQFSYNILRSACSIKNVKAPIEVISQGREDEMCEYFLNNYAPTHIIAIERPGRSIDGRCYSMKGEDLADIVPNTDILFQKAKRASIKTIAIGDGGNEVGMGKVKNLVKSHVKFGEKICADVSADYLILAGISNWGAYALVAALSIVSGKMLLHGPFIEASILNAIIDAGGVDGCTRENSLSVDGLQLKSYLKVLQKINEVVEKNLMNRFYEIDL